MRVGVLYKAAVADRSDAVRTDQIGGEAVGVADGVFGDGRVVCVDVGRRWGSQKNAVDKFLNRER